MNEVEREPIEIRALNSGSDAEHMESRGFTGNNGGSGSGVKLMAIEEFQGGRPDIELMETGEFECFNVVAKSNVTCKSSVQGAAGLTSNAILRDATTIELPPRPRRG